MRKPCRPGECSLGVELFFISFFLPSCFSSCFLLLPCFSFCIPFLSSLLLFHEKNNIKIFNCKVFLHQYFLFIGWCVCVLCGTSSRSAADLICFWCIVEGQFKPAQSKSQRFCRWKSYIFKATLNLRKWVSLNKVATLFKVVLGNRVKRPQTKVCPFPRRSWPTCRTTELADCCK